VARGTFSVFEVFLLMFVQVWSGLTLKHFYPDEIKFNESVHHVDRVGRVEMVDNVQVEFVTKLTKNPKIVTSFCFLLQLRQTVGKNVE